MSDTSDSYQQLAQAFTRIGEALSETWKQIQPVIQAISAAAWQAYRNDGMPYGDSHEGLMRWLEDMGEIRRHEAEIERIRDHLDTLVVARKLGEEMRARTGIAQSTRSLSNPGRREGCGDQ